MEKAYKFRLYPTAKQEELIRKTIGCSRFVYNQTLAARKGAYASGSSIHMTFKESHSGYDCVKLLPGLRIPTHGFERWTPPPFRSEERRVGKECRL